MALRRLLSGWLIAVAALARSMALVLERAAADRSEPTPNSVPGPVMAALAERYPGAPDHWLALVAERTSQLADAGEAPLSLSSRPSAWPQSLPGADEPLEPLMPTAPSGDDAVRRASPSPVVHASSQRDAVPSLAALQGRSSEVWRRPQASQGRRPRPVFAQVEPALQRVSSAPQSGVQTGRRPRSPLTLEARPPSDAPVGMPAPVAPPSESVTRDHAWSETTPARAEKPVESAFRAPPRTPPAPELGAGPEVASRPEPLARRADAPAVALPTSRFVFGETSTTASALRKVSAFQPSLDTPPRDGSPSSVERPVVLDAQAADGLAFSPSPRRSTVRRSIFRALAALGDRARASSVHHHQAVTKPGPPGIAGTPTDRGARSSAPRSDVSQFARQPPLPAATASHARPPQGDEPPIRAQPSAVVSTPRTPSPTWAPAFTAEDFANDETPRASFPIPRPSSINTSAPRFARSLTDDRWPKFPANVFAPPVVAEIPSPRLNQLAREQEEGRWNV